MSLPSFDTMATAALAACTATTFSNPAEVAKTRLQLQGELVKKGTYKPIYTGPIDVIRKSWHSEGVHGIQRGLTGALAYSTLLQTCILALYEPFRSSLNVLAGKSSSDRYLASTIGGGTCTGIVGAFLGNPLFLIKARMQAYSPAFPVGTQRHYKSAWDALKSIQASDGFTGLFRGSRAAMFRTSLGTSVQMPTYFFTKSRLGEYGILRPDSLLTVIASSAAAGGMVCLLMSPADTTLTRLYNQPTQRLPDGSVRGTLYRGPFDCLFQTVKQEGITALYRGAFAHFLRITPHITILLTANEYFSRWYRHTVHNQS